MILGETSMARTAHTQSLAQIIHWLRATVAGARLPAPSRDPEADRESVLRAE